MFINWKNILLDSSLRLENSRTILTPLLFEHVESLAQIGIDDRIWTHNPNICCKSKGDIEKYTLTALQQRDMFTRIPFVILDKKTNRIAGSSSFQNMSQQHRKLKIGSTWLGIEFQRTGLNSAVKSAQYQFAFETLKCKRVEIHTDTRNKASWDSILRHGCKLEGVLRNDIIKHDGVERDTAIFSILDNEYQAQKDKLIIN